MATSKPITRAKIIGQGKAVPEKVLTNHDLEKMVDTSDEWIQTRTGIRERRILEEGRTSADLTRLAIEQALQQAGIPAKDIDLIIVGTLCADELIPSTACRVQHLIGAPHAFGFDLNAACTGYLYGLTMANSMIVCGKIKTALVVGTDILSRVTNWEDRTTCVLFGDGSGASVLMASHDETGIIDSYMASDGSLGDILIIPQGGVAKPLTHEGLDQRQNCIQMRGNEVFKIAVKKMEAASRRVLKKAGMTIDDVDIIIPHQANIRIIKSLAQRLNAPEEKLHVTVHKYGNTSASSIPLAISDAMDEKRIQPGTVGLFMAFGSGLTWGATLIRF